MRREVAEETGGLLELAPSSPSPPVIWDHLTKQAIFIREMSPGEQLLTAGVRISLQVSTEAKISVQVDVQVDDIVSQVQRLGRPPEHERDLYEIAGAPPECVLTIAWIDVDQLRNVPLKWYIKPVIRLLLTDTRLEHLAPALHGHMRGIPVEDFGHTQSSRQ